MSDKEYNILSDEVYNRNNGIVVNCHTAIVADFHENTLDVDEHNGIISNQVESVEVEKTDDIIAVKFEFTDVDYVYILSNGYDDLILVTYEHNSNGQPLMMYHLSIDIDGVNPDDLYHTGLITKIPNGYIVHFFKNSLLEFTGW